MSTFEISAPSSSTGIQWADLKGSLLLFKVHSYEPSLTTQFSKAPGDASAVRADVTVLDGDLTGTEYTDTLVFPKVLQSQIKGKVGGGLVLGRLEQGAPKSGQSAPWKLAEDLTKADKDLAVAHLEKNDTPPF